MLVSAHVYLACFDMSCQWRMSWGHTSGRNDRKFLLATIISGPGPGNLVCGPQVDLEVPEYTYVDLSKRCQIWHIIRKAEQTVADWCKYDD